MNLVTVLFINVMKLSQINHYCTGESSARQLLSILLSNDTVSYQIMDIIAKDLNEQMVDQINKMSAIQINEAADSAKDVHLLMYIRYVYLGKIRGDFFFF
jgi:hypothetical protein